MQVLSLASSYQRGYKNTTSCFLDGAGFFPANLSLLLLFVGGFFLPVKVSLVKVSLSRSIFYSACDIKELKIVKSAVEAVHTLPKNVTPSKLSKETEKELDIAASAGRVVEAKNEIGPTDSSNGPGMCKSALSQNLRATRDSRKTDGGNRYHRNGTATPSKDRLGLDNNGTGSVSPLRHTPTSDRDPGNGVMYRNNGTREK